MIKFLLHSKLITIICIHLLIGVIAVAVPKMTLLITVFVFLFGVIDIVKNKDRNNEALFYCCYVVGVEVFLRMTGGMIFNEYAKYTVMVFCFLGLLYQNFKADKFIYIALLLLLLPAVIIGLQEASYEVNLRKAMMFNISGQLTLLVAAIYTLNKNIRYQDLIKIPYLLALPILSIVSFIIVKSPSLKVAMTSTQFRIGNVLPVCYFLTICKNKNRKNHCFNFNGSLCVPWFINHVAWRNDLWCNHDSFINGICVFVW